MSGASDYRKRIAPTRKHTKFIDVIKDSTCPDEDYVVVEKHRHSGEVWLSVSEINGRALVMLTPKKARRLANAILGAID